MQDHSAKVQHPLRPAHKLYIGRWMLPIVDPSLVCSFLCCRKHMIVHEVVNIENKHHDE